MADNASHLLDLIDAYAARAGARGVAYDAAAWAFADAHRDMIAARAAVIDALGIADAPPLTDALTRAADQLAEADAAWAARIDEALS